MYRMTFARFAKGVDGISLTAASRESPSHYDKRLSFDVDDKVGDSIARLEGDEFAQTAIGVGERIVGGFSDGCARDWYVSLEKATGEGFMYVRSRALRRVDVPDILDMLGRIISDILQDDL